MTFTEQEIKGFKLKRRHETKKVKFSLSQIMGKQEGTASELSEEVQENMELQHKLALTITKILE